MNPSTDHLPEPLPVSVAGRTHDPIIPACPVCGSITERLTTTERRCSFGHVSRLSFGEHPHMIRGIISESWTMRAVAVLVMMVAGLAQAEEVPRSLLAGILAVETHSTLRADGSVEYRDQRIGAAGELGPSQIGRMVVLQWHLSPYRLQTDTRYAMAATVRHLRWLHAQLGTWDLANAWNGGVAGRNRSSAISYARRVAAAGRK